jgi:pyruvate-formate lyase
MYSLLVSSNHISTCYYGILQVRKTHNQGVFDAYTAEMKRARKSGILTGLPDGYGA